MVLAKATEKFDKSATPVLDSSKMAPKQFKMYMDAADIKFLHDTAKKYGRGSGQEMVADLIKNYLKFWEQAEKVRRATIEHQFEEYAKHLESQGVEQVDFTSYNLGNEFTEWLAQKYSRRRASPRKKEGNNHGR